jgi:hypothetical protein
LTRPRGAGVQGQFSSDECMSCSCWISNLILMYHILIRPHLCPITTTMHVAT